MAARRAFLVGTVSWRAVFRESSKPRTTPRGEIADGEVIDRPLVPVGGEPQEELQGVAVRQHRVLAHVAFGSQMRAEEAGHKSGQLRGFHGASPPVPR